MTARANRTLKTAFGSNMAFSSPKCPESYQMGADKAFSLPNDLFFSSGERICPFLYGNYLPVSQGNPANGTIFVADRLLKNLR